MRTVLPILMLLPACTPSVDPVLECQRRILDKIQGPQLDPSDAAIKANAWGRAPLLKLDRKGCSKEQLAMVDRLIAMTYELEQLNEANTQASRSGYKARHMGAYDRFIDKLYAYDDLGKSAAAELDRLEAEHAQ